MQQHNASTMTIDNAFQIGQQAPLSPVPRPPRPALGQQSCRKVGGFYLWRHQVSSRLKHFTLFYLFVPRFFDHSLCYVCDLLFRPEIKFSLFYCSRHQTRRPFPSLLTPPINNVVCFLAALLVSQPRPLHLLSATKFIVLLLNSITKMITDGDRAKRPILRTRPKPRRKLQLKLETSNQTTDSRLQTSAVNAKGIFNIASLNLATYPASPSNLPHFKLWLRAEAVSGSQMSQYENDNPLRFIITFGCRLHSASKDNGRDSNDDNDKGNL